MPGWKPPNFLKALPPPYQILIGARAPSRLCYTLQLDLVLRVSLLTSQPDRILWKYPSEFFVHISVKSQPCILNTKIVMDRDSDHITRGYVFGGMQARSASARSSRIPFLPGEPGNAV